MHVLYVIDNLAAGGAQTSLLAMSPHIVRDGVRLTVASLGDPVHLASQLTHAGCTVVHLSAGTRLRRAIALGRLIRQIRPDLVHTTLFESDLAGRLAAVSCSVPVTSTLANEAYGQEHLRDPRLRWHRVRAVQALDAATARCTARLHAVSSSVADVMSRRLLYPPDRIDVVHRGRDAGVLGLRTSARREAIRAAMGWAKHVPVLLTVARHEYQKGLDTAAQALPTILRAHPSARWVVAGREGNATAGLHRQLQALGIVEQVDFLGHRRDVAELMCGSDLLLFPTRWEGLPGVVLEAMALELPIIASDIPAMRDVLDDGTARLVPVDDHGALATAVFDVLSAPDLAADRAARARSRFLSSFTVEAVARGLVSFWWSVLGSTRRADVLAPTRSSRTPSRW